LERTKTSRILTAPPTGGRQQRPLGGRIQKILLGGGGGGVTEGTASKLTSSGTPPSPEEKLAPTGGEKLKEETETPRKAAQKPKKKDWGETCWNRTEMVQKKQSDMEAPAKGFEKGHPHKLTKP